MRTATKERGGVTVISLRAARHILVVAVDYRNQEEQYLHTIYSEIGNKFRITVF
jgi:hypothetical protein